MRKKNSYESYSLADFEKEKAEKAEARIQRKCIEASEKPRIKAAKYKQKSKLRHYKHREAMEDYEEREQVASMVEDYDQQLAKDIRMEAVTNWAKKHGVDLSKYNVEESVSV